VNTASGDAKRGLESANQALKILREIGAEKEAAMVVEAIKRAEETMTDDGKGMTNDKKSMTNGK
jgi:hypothetical protein